MVRLGEVVGRRGLPLSTLGSQANTPRTRTDPGEIPLAVGLHLQTNPCGPLPSLPLKVGFGQVPQPSQQSSKSAKTTPQKRPRSWQNPIVDILWTPAIIGLALARPRSISHISGSCAVTMVPANSPTYRDFLHPLVAPWSTQTERSSKMCIVDHCRQHRPRRPLGSTEMLD